MLRYPNLLIVLSVFFILLSSTVSGQGNLLITPRRVVFEGGKKIHELNVANTGKDTARYVVSLVDFRMKEDGSFEKITEPDSNQRFAGKYLRFFPRNVLLGPNEAQVIKIQLRNATQLAEGEYRSHVFFRAVPEEKPLGEAPKTEPGTISVQLTAVFGITIPVIIRVGISDTKVTISSGTFKIVNDTIPKLDIELSRTGNMSVYGDITVDYISEKGKSTRVGLARGVAVYTPNTIRRFSMELDKKAKTDFHNGMLRISYLPQGSSEPPAEKEVQLE